MFTIATALRTHGQARIIAFEPMPSTFAVLSANCAALESGSLDAQLNIPEGTHRSLSVTPLNVGLSDAPATVRACLRSVYTRG